MENQKARQILNQGSRQLGERLTELKQENKILLQQLENLKARQARDQGSLQELADKVEGKLSQLVTITVPTYYADAAQVGEQQAFESLGLQPEPTKYSENQENEIEPDTNLNQVSSPWGSSTETLPLPKTPDTPIKSKPRNITPGGTRLNLEEK